MRVKITKPARADVRNIYAHLERETSRTKAKEIASEIRERCAGLSRMPKRYQKLDGFENQGLRRRVYRDYLIVYRIKNDHVQVLRIIHGAADLQKLLKDLS